MGKPKPEDNIVPADLTDKVRAHINDQVTKMETEWVGDAEGMVE